MTRQKSFKRKVRTRMEKTNESYTAARRQLLAKAKGASPTTPSPIDSGHDITANAGEGQTSDETVRARTGRSLTEWFALLDHWGASNRKHPDIAKWLTAEHSVTGWWAQSITVAYERARGMRAPLQQSHGLFGVSSSKTVGVSVERLFGAFMDPALREKWLLGESLEVTTAQPAKSIRAKWGDGGTRVAIGFYPKGDSKSQVALQHDRLSDAGVAKETKAFWTQRMDVLKKLLES